jgi:hypothetical protein
MCFCITNLTVSDVLDTVLNWQPDGKFKHSSACLFFNFFIMGHVLGGRATVIIDGDCWLISIMNISLHNSIYQLWKVRSARSLSSRIDVLLVST